MQIGCGSIEVAEAISSLSHSVRLERRFLSAAHYRRLSRGHITHSAVTEKLL